MGARRSDTTSRPLCGSRDALPEWRRRFRRVAVALGSLRSVREFAMGGPIRPSQAFRWLGELNDWEHHAHPPRLVLCDGGFGLLNPCRLRRRRGNCGTHRRPRGADCTLPSSNSKPAAPVHSDARALQSHAEPNVRHTGLGLLAQRTHAISRSNSAGTPRSANTRCSHRGTPIGAASRPCRIFDLGARHMITTSSGAAGQNSRFPCYCLHRPIDRRRMDTSAMPASTKALPRMPTSPSE